MKKITLWLAALCGGAIILSGCNILDKANGIILYGDEEKVLSSLKEEHKGQVEKESLSVKLMHTDGKRLMIMDETSAQYLLEKELLQEVKDGRDTEALSSIPELAEGETLLFAKKEDSDIGFDSLPDQMNYEGNIIIGDGRVYADMFLVVTDESFTELEAEAKTMGIIQYNKDPGGIGGFGVEKEQLVKIEE
ncbi:lipoprotein BA_5634 family protein [Planomicrobium sp. Y74]|uniref:lipoprotein BA_5634 family protein n=1 Tax=Planomicrobium sp. Y74 TaxID=2478977 RepID=UPI000EF50ADE|nr:lipoprotein BA_5634 family protein [Planomicrobium sp. Y74]RLQ92527.1 hypothetical protein D9754_00475 [Planomicrobium sp. Y74]